MRAIKGLCFWVIDLRVAGGSVACHALRDCVGSKFFEDVSLSIQSADPRIPFDGLMSMHFYQRAYRVCVDTPRAWLDQSVMACPIVAAEIAMRSLVAVERMHGFFVARALYLRIARHPVLASHHSLASHWNRNQPSIYPLLFSLTDPPTLLASFKVYVDPSTAALSNRPLECLDFAEVMVHRTLLGHPEMLTTNPADAKYRFIPMYLSCMNRLYRYDSTELSGLVATATAGMSHGLVVVHPSMVDLFNNANVTIITTGETPVSRNGRHITVPDTASAWIINGVETRVFSDLIDLLCRPFFNVHPCSSPLGTLHCIHGPTCVSSNGPDVPIPRSRLCCPWDV